MATDQSKTSDLAKAGQAYYDEHLKLLVEAGNHGKFLILDVESGDYEIDEDDVTATSRLRSRHPGCLTYGVRIGYSAAYQTRRLDSDRPREIHVIATESDPLLGMRMLEGTRIVIEAVDNGEVIIEPLAS